jgi:O-antigen biosynthesis protein
MTDTLFRTNQTQPETLRRVIPEIGKVVVPLELEPVAPRSRPVVRGKFLYAGDEKLYLRGVTYGPFRPEAAGTEFAGSEYHTPEVVDRDFSQMAGAGLNSVRVYTPPPRWLLDAAQRHGLYVMIGLPWEQHVSFLDNRRTQKSIIERVRQGVTACANHPAVLCFAIGNEIPASMVRWYGAPRVEKFLRKLYNTVKSVDGAALVTYVNYPSSEYLHLPFLDFAAFNVYLEEPAKLEAYLARLQNIAGDRPLILAEVGLDSRRNGDEAQAGTLRWQLHSSAAAGAAGLFVFAWTDEWFRGGMDIDDWDFGLTTRERTPKPALAVVREAFKEWPFPKNTTWPRISIVVCTYNGSRTIADCLRGVARLEYPDYETIVVNDGSKDQTPAIVQKFDVRLISIPNGGLSNARNVGMRAATGEIVAYIDDDARPDPHWLQHLAWTFMSGNYAGVGGPNIPPPEDGMVAEAVANSPGNPTHVLTSDQIAEHIPGCNMAFRRSALLAINGCDAQFRIAGDDVDLCWRIQQAGGVIAFSPAAMVWHHRRNRVKTYWKQQMNYGRAEAALERKWPEKYNAWGHVTWHGRLYCKGVLEMLFVRSRRIYHGTWGAALFQSVYDRATHSAWTLLLIPELYMVLALLMVLGISTPVWRPVLFVLAALGLIASIFFACAVGFRISAHPRSKGLRRLKLLVSWLHIIQPVARLYGRMSEGLTPLRRHGINNYALPRPQNLRLWSQQWRTSEDRLCCLEEELKERGAVVLRGGDFDRWDLEVRGGLFGGSRIRTAIEEHGQGKQLVRTKVLPHWPLNTVIFTLVLWAFAGLAIMTHSWVAGLPFTLMAVMATFLALEHSARSTAAVIQAHRQCARKATSDAVEERVF